MEPSTCGATLSLGTCGHPNPSLGVPASPAVPARLHAWQWNTGDSSDPIPGVTWWPQWRGGFVYRSLTGLRQSPTLEGGQRAPGTHFEGLATSCFCSHLLSPTRAWRPGLAKGHPCPLHVTPSHHTITHTRVPATPPCSPLLAPVTITVLPVRSAGHLQGSQGLLCMAQSSRARSRSSRSHHGGLRIPSSSMAGYGMGLGTEVTAGPLPSRQRGTARVPLLRELLGAEEGQQSGWSR